MTNDGSGNVSFSKSLWLSHILNSKQEFTKRKYIRTELKTPIIAYLHSKLSQNELYRDTVARKLEYQQNQGSVP